jgi:hypothetical protein
VPLPAFCEEKVARNCSGYTTTATSMTTTAAVPLPSL